MCSLLVLRIRLNSTQTGVEVEVESKLGFKSRPSWTIIKILNYYWKVLEKVSISKLIFIQLQDWSDDIGNRLQTCFIIRNKTCNRFPIKLGNLIYWYNWHGNQSCCHSNWYFVASRTSSNFCGAEQLQHMLWLYPLCLLYEHVKKNWMMMHS